MAGMQVGDSRGAIPLLARSIAREMYHVAEGDDDADDEAQRSPASLH